MTGNLSFDPSLDLERRRIALQAAAELHDAKDLSALMATASNLYGWLSLPPGQVMQRARTFDPVI